MNNYTKRLNSDIDVLLEENNINENEFRYYEMFYNNLEEKEKATKLALVSVSYNLINNISYNERILFTEGMYTYIELTKKLFEAKDTEDFDSSAKKSMILNWAKEDFELGVVPIMYEEGIDSAIKLVDEVEKETEVSKKKKTKLI